MPAPTDPTNESVGPIDVQEGPPIRIRENLTNIASEGAQAAKKAFRLGSSKVRQRFGAAMGETIVEGGSSLRRLIRHPFKYSFITVMFLVAISLAGFGLITALLLPVFTMGYITIMKRLNDDDSMSFEDFIVFMRHGWDSLWHIVMMLASFIVTLAAMITPVLLALMLAYFAFGSLGSVVGQIGQFASSSDTPRRQTNDFDTPRRSTPSSSEDGAFSWIGKMFTNVGAEVVRFIMLVVFSLVAILFLAPLVAAIILIFYLALDVVSSEVDSSHRYDLVYDAFGRMLNVARIHWKRLLCSSLFLPSIFVIVIFLIAILSRILVFER